MTFTDKIKLLWKALGPFKEHAILLFVVMLLSALFEALGIGMIVPLLTILLGNAAVPLGNQSSLLVRFASFLRSVFTADTLLLGVIAIILVVYLVKTILMILKTFLMVYVANLLRRYWMSGILERYLFSEYSRLVSQERGVLLNNLANEPTNAHRAIRRIIIYLSELTASFGIYAIMLTASWILTSVLTAAAVLFVAVFWGAIQRYSLSVGRRTLALDQSIMAQAEESLSALREIRAFGLEEQTLRIFNNRLDKLLSIILRFRTYLDVPVPVAEFCVVVFLAAGLLYGEYIRQGTATSMVPLLGFFAIASHKLCVTLSNLISEGMSIVSYLPSLQLVHDLMPDQRYESSVAGGICIAELDGDIVFDQVSYAYPNAKGRLFENLSLRIPRGKMIGIIGNSGSGKSTLADLVCGLYPTYDGDIRVGKYELREIDSNAWHRIIGLVTQEPFIFNTTVRENIMLGRQDATEGEMINAARKAHAHEFISLLSHGYDTVVADQGALSVGQKQRITIARAILHDPELFIFDEATSALDPETEKYIQAFIESLDGRKTVVFITHRYNNIENADIVYVIERGRIVDSGLYRDLKSVTSAGTSRGDGK